MIKSLLININVQFLFDMFQYIVLKCPRRYVDGVYAILYEKIQDYP